MGVVFVACAVVTTSEIQRADTVENDGDDYSSWFAGFESWEVEDFETQDDADQLLYPTPVSEPEHEGGPPGNLARAAHESRLDGYDLSTVNAVGSGSGSSGSGSSGSGSGSGGTCAPAVTIGGTLPLSLPWSVSVPAQYVGTITVLRQHHVYVGGSASGTADLTLSGSLTAGPNSWSATISVTGGVSATAWVNVYQQLVGPFRSGWFSAGDATISGSVSYADSVTFSQSCNPPGVIASTPGTPAITANAMFEDTAFYGFFFPRLHGPVVTGIRGAIAQWARNFFNRLLPGLIQPAVFSANQVYAQKKQLLLDWLIARIPPGCGCAPAVATVGN